MPRFADFKSATKADVPSYLQAEIQRSQIANQAQQAENARRSQNVMGAGMLYNEGMGKKTPIADYLSSALRGDPGSGAAVPVVDKSTWAPGMEPEAAGGMPEAAFNLGGAPVDPYAATATAGGMPNFDMSAFADSAAPAADAAAAMPSFDPSQFTGAAEAAGALPNFDPSQFTGVTDAAGAADAASAAGGMSPLTPLLAASQLAQGDVGGAASTGAKGYLATLGPYGLAAGVIASMLGL